MMRRVRLLMHALLLLGLLPLVWASAPRPAPPTAPANPAPVGALQIGLNSHLATRYPDAATLDDAAAIVADLGVGWVREDLHWHRIQPAAAEWDWVFSDNALHALDRRGLQILAVLGPSVGWATAEPGDGNRDVSYYPPPVDGFVAYTTQVVKRYAGIVDAWEIWNEPDLGVFWRPAPDPAAYAELLIATSAAIRAIDPTTPILLGGVNPFNADYVAQIAAAGAWPSFDILAIHPYVDPNSPESGALEAAADRLHALMDLYGAKPLWATEVGYASGPGDRDARGVFDAEQQADLLARSYLALWQAGIDHIFWYTLKDDPHNPYGLYAFGSGRGDFRQPKPAAAALRDLSALAQAAVAPQRIDAAAQQLVRSLSSEDWLRPSQPNGRIRSDAGGSRLDLLFTTARNDYLVFAFAEPPPLPAQTHHLAVEVSGDGAGHALNVWLRDADGDILQYRLGLLQPGVTALSGPIGGRVGDADRIEQHGNGRFDAPASVVALVIDDQPDGWSGTAAVTLRNLHAAYGSDGRALQLQQRDGRELIIAWYDRFAGELQLPPERSWYRFDARVGCRADQAIRTARLSPRISAFSSSAAAVCIGQPAIALPPDATAAGSLSGLP